VHAHNIKVVNHHRQEYTHLGKVIGQPYRCCWRAESMNHYYRRRSSRDKYCEDNNPHGDHEKKSKINPAKQDLKDHTC
jgi:hypothetical protein